MLQMHQQMTELRASRSPRNSTLRMGGDAMTKEVGTYTTEVISVSTAPIADAMFEIPSGYTVIQR